MCACQLTLAKFRHKSPVVSTGLLYLVKADGSIDQPIGGGIDHCR